MNEFEYDSDFKAYCYDQYQLYLAKYDRDNSESEQEILEVKVKWQDSPYYCYNHM